MEKGASEKTTKSQSLKGRLVVAIDFGTTFSGYAFAFATGKVPVIEMNKNWSGGNFQSFKTPTSVLFRTDGEVDFGYEAELKFSSGETEGDLYRYFKMALYNQNITKSLMIKATNGQEQLAVDVFAEALKYLKKHVIDAINLTVTNKIENYMINWVITIPAIWEDGAKQFMREVAMQAQLIEWKNSPQLVLALEPEAASIYCKELAVNTTELPHGADCVGAQLNVGTEYLVIDAGGGTVDIVAHKVLEGGFVREILHPTGGPWGGAQVDKQFEELLKEIMGVQVIEKIQQNGEQWLKLQFSFEIAKKDFNPNLDQSKIKLDMNYQLCKIYEQCSGMDVEKGLSSTRNKHVCFTNGKLVIDHETCIGLFKSTVQKIAAHVQELLQTKAELSDITLALLVGGFADCAMLQSAIKEILPRGVGMVVPGAAQLAIVNGAVRFGLNTKLVESRFARKTYGIAIEPWFREARHRRDKRVLRGTDFYCKDVFLMFIEKGTPLDIDDITSRTVKARTDDQTIMGIDIFCCDETDLNDVEYVTDDKFTRLGDLTVLMPETKGGKNREVEVQFMFGGTEILVSARDITSGQTAATEINLLLA